jgi:hypothetical protein
MNSTPSTITKAHVWYVISLTNIISLYVRMACLQRCLSCILRKTAVNTTNWLLVLEHSNHLFAFLWTKVVHKNCWSDADCLSTDRSKNVNHIDRI